MKLAESVGAGSFIGHRSACIEKYVAPEVGFLLVFAYVKTVAFPVDFPVEVSNFISRNVLPVLLEFDAETLVRGAMEPRTKAFHHSSCQDLMVGESGKVFRV
jgi:hypothetical protein